MIAPDWFVRELKLIDKDYFCVWDGRLHRWMIRWWNTPHIEKRDIKNSEDFRKKSILVMKVAEEDGNGKDIGYRDLDQRTLTTLRRRKWLSNLSTEKLIRMLDNANEENQNKTDEEIRDMIRDAATISYNAMKRIWW